MTATPTEWTEIQIDTTELGAELLAAELADQVDGVEIRDAGTLISAEPGRATVVCLVDPQEADACLGTATAVLDRAGKTGRG